MPADESISTATRAVPVCLGATPAVQRTLVFDTVMVDAVNRAVRCFETASGKSLNVARVLRALGWQPLALGFVGGDVTAAIREDLDRAGIRHHLITVAAKTRTCTTVLDRSCGTATELVEEPRPVESAAWPALLRALREALNSAGALILSGSLPPGAPQDFYAECTALAVRAGIPVLLDAAGEPLRRALAAGPFLVKPNCRELHDAVGMSVETDQSIRKALQQLVRAGAQWGLVTLGPRGALLCDGHSFWSISQPPVRAVNPIGSGDAVAAGFAAACLGGSSVPEAARFAVACGAANAMTEIAGHLSAAEVPALVESVTVIRSEG